MIDKIRYKGDKIRIVYEYNSESKSTNNYRKFNVIIRYSPNKYIPDIESLRLYISKQCSLEIPYEFLCRKIRDDFNTCISPNDLNVSLDFKLMDKDDYKVLTEGYVEI